LTRNYDVAVFGSGFAGSLIAMIAKRQGYSVVLLERGKHPRMTIGESSTPLANLLLEELATRYDLPAIRPLAKWGSWQRAYPHIGCGLKRGFTFYHHEAGKPVETDPDHLHQLLVAASPHDEIGDAHWYRPDFDLFLADQAQALGVDFIDEARTEHFCEVEDGVCFELVSKEQTVGFQASFAIDATGPRGMLHRALQLTEACLPGYPSTEALYNHFSGVSLPNAQRGSDQEVPPYPPEQAAVHHVFDGGWVWVLRFNNGITSAGVAGTVEVGQQLRLHEGEAAWNRLLDSMPTLKEQFANARAELPFTYMPRLSFLSSRVTGRRWAMLPSAAGFIDPLLSTGFPLTLLGVSRLAAILGSDLAAPSFESELQTYAIGTTEELLATSRLIAGLYANMSNFPVFKSIALLYFAAASYSETARRLGKSHLASSFLLHDHPEFGPLCKQLLERAMHVAPGKESWSLIQDVRQAIEPIDVAGFSDSSKQGWYPVNAEDLLKSASKVETSRGEIESMLTACGFYRAEVG